MKQKFFTNTIQSNFIKSIIYNTPIPLLNTVNDSSYLIEGNLYIYKNNIIKCTKSGIIKMPEVENGYTPYYRNGEIIILNDSEISEESSGDFSSDIRVSNDSLIVSEEVGYYKEGDAHINYSGMYNDEQITLNIDSNYTINKFELILKNCVILTPCKFKVINNYKFGKYYPKFTELYHSSIDYYDSVTHEYLGKLLRCYRDIYDVDLMPYYNCVTGDYISNVVIYPTRIKKEDSKDYKTFKIPIKYNTTYTLAMDCNYTVKVAPILINNGFIIENVKYYTDNGSSEGIELNDELIKDNIYYFNSLSFKQPVTVGITTLNKDLKSILQKYEKYLYLLIQVPKGNDSSIVLLEGNYTNVSTNHIYNIENINNLNNLELSKLFTTNLSLLQMNDNVTYPYADRLLEYLLLAVINNTDLITDNIKRTQDLFISVNSVPGVWDNILRSNVYLNYQKTKDAKQLDLNGFVDKDTEALIKRLS